jgi:methylmalonyl-CoA mutase C-terminal domain/subunit
VAEKRLRILVAKPGLDGHDRGAKIIARALRDGGFEVIYTGLHQTPEMIADVMRLLKERGAGDIAVFGGGIIPEDDAKKLRELGVKEVFTPGASTEDIVKWLSESVQPRE